jgi:hypothetical protein
MPLTDGTVTNWLRRVDEWKGMMIQNVFGQWLGWNSGYRI